MTGLPPNPDVATLVAHIEKHLILLGESAREVDAAIKEDIPKLGKSPRAAVLVAGLLENYYTCTETIFVRISQFFENNLSKHSWHKDLLMRMTLQIEGIRPRLLSDEVFVDLVELMRFRHFRRYYFGTAYDWTRIEELLVRVKRTHPKLEHQIGDFLVFLRKMEHEPQE